jgi:hypothetical protein
METENLSLIDNDLLYTGVPRQWFVIYRCSLIDNDLLYTGVHW